MERLAKDFFTPVLLASWANVIKLKNHGNLPSLYGNAVIP
jgi:hypothetical protein